MKRQMLLAAALACTMGMPLVACSGNDAQAPAGDAAQQSESGFDAVEAYWGQWRGSVESSGEESVYGTMGGEEAMLDVMLNEDGTCSVEPLEAHADLPAGEGTWDGTESEIVLHLESGDVTLTVTEPDAAEGNAADFGIEGFDTIKFDFYG